MSTDKEMKKEDKGTSDNVNMHDSQEDKKSTDSNASAKPGKDEASSSKSVKGSGKSKGESGKKSSDNRSRKEQSTKEKLAEAQEKYLRLSAEFDNYRKRTLKEKMDLTKTAGESLLVNLLPVMDDFDRAMTVMESATDCNAMKEGIDLIYTKMQEFLKQNGVREIEAREEDFDTDLHEAVTKIPAPDKKLKGKVVDVIQKGYYLNEKVMRYSKVVVGE